MPPQIYDNLQELGEKKVQHSIDVRFEFSKIHFETLPTLMPFQLPVDLIAPAAQFVDDFFLKWFFPLNQIAALFVIETKTRPREKDRKTTTRE